MIERSATIRNEMGIHCRPSVLIMNEVAGFAGEVCVAADTGKSDLRSVITLMALGLHRGMQVTISVEGEGEEEMGGKLVELFEREFDFPPQAKTSTEETLG